MIESANYDTKFRGGG